MKILKPFLDPSLVKVSIVQCVIRSISEIHSEGLTLNKRYFIIDQQIARHFVHYSEYLSTPPLLFPSM